MALIQCPECGKEISNLSDKCIYCGFPMKSIKNSQLIIKAEKYPSNDLVTCRISILTLDGVEIAELHTGTAITIPINNEMEIYAKYKHSPLAEKCRSNSVKIQANTCTRLQISYQRSFLFNKLYIYQVDNIDSE